MFPAIRLKASVCRGVSGRRTAAHIVAAAKPILYDMPVSNNGARCRFILYKKRLSDQYSIEPPSNIGGLKSEQYLKLNPQGKMPLLVMEGGRELLPESEVIVQYLLDKHRDIGGCMHACVVSIHADSARSQTP